MLNYQRVLIPSKPPSPESPKKYPCALGHLRGDHRETSKLFIRVALALDQVIHLAKARIGRASVVGRPQLRFFSEGCPMVNNG